VTGAPWAQPEIENQEYRQAVRKGEQQNGMRLTAQDYLQPG
jgi:hypothetical protein